jgi:biopolymer transport protein ExbD
LPAQTTTTAPPEPEAVTGDVNDDGEISVEDAQLALKAYTKRISGKDMELSDKQIKAANVNGDEELSVDDAQLILKYYTEKYVAGKNITWGDLLGKQPQPRPVSGFTLRKRPRKAFV